MGTARQQQKARTADRVLAAAAELFAEKGFAETTTREIARRAGVATGTVFTHFPDKSQLLAQVLQERIEAVLEETLATVPATAPLADQLVHLSEGLIRYYLANASLARELIGHATFHQGEEARGFNRQMRAYLDTCGTLVDAAIRRGELSAQADAEGIARCYLAFHFFVVNGCLRDSNARPEQYLQQLRAMVDTLLAGRQATARRN
jgi:AcrR family transcriptional regulator